MTDWSALRALLGTDPLDCGCDEALALLHTYADLYRVDPVAAALEHPAVAVHLAACGPCAEDLAGLLAAIEHS
jgi:hypothetical protein